MNALVRDFCFPKTTVSYYPSSFSILEHQHIKTLNISHKAIEHYVTSRHRNDLDDDIDGDGDIKIKNTTNNFTYDTSNNDENNIDNDSSVIQSFKSIFGYNASNAIYKARSAFESWKQWKLVSKIYYNTKPKRAQTKGAQEREGGNTDFGMDSSVIGKNVHGPYFLRAANLWAKIERWCEDTNSGIVGNRILKSLVHGVSYHDSRFFQLKLRNKQHEGLRALEAIYAFYDGQSMQSTRGLWTFRGLIGGYCAYNFLTVTHLLDGATAEKMFLFEANKEYFPIAASMFQQKKSFKVRVDTGEVVMCASGGYNNYPALYHIRDGVVRSGGGSGGGSETVANRGAGDEALVWMEELAHRLLVGEIETGRISDDNRTDFIAHYPTLMASARLGAYPKPVPVVSRAVTRGVEVVGSGVFAPEMGCHIYSIQMRLLTPEDEGYELPSSRNFLTCQLMTRDWKMVSHVSHDVEEVTGDGVIGIYPLLSEGEHRKDSGDTASNVSRGGIETEPFKYQSCCGPIQGSFKGRIKFMPGSLSKPHGDPFWVEVAPFALDLTPRAIY